MSWWHYVAAVAVYVCGMAHGRYFRIGPRCPELTTAGKRAWRSQLGSTVRCEHEQWHTGPCFAGSRQGVDPPHHWFPTKELDGG